MQDMKLYSKTFTQTEAEVENILTDLEDKEFLETELEKQGYLN